MSGRSFITIDAGAGGSGRREIIAANQVQMGSRECQCAVNLLHVKIALKLRFDVNWF